METEAVADLEGNKWQVIKEQTRPLLIKADEVIAMLGLSSRTFWRLLEQGRIPQPIRLTRRLLRWNREHFEKWVADGCIDAKTGQTLQGDD